MQLELIKTNVILNDKFVTNEIESTKINVNDDLSVINNSNLKGNVIITGGLVVPKTI